MSEKQTGADHAPSCFVKFGVTARCLNEEVQTTLEIWIKIRSEIEVLEANLLREKPFETGKCIRQPKAREQGERKRNDQRNLGNTYRKKPKIRRTNRAKRNAS